MEITLLEFCFLSYQRALIKEASKLNERCTTRKNIGAWNKGKGWKKEEEKGDASFLIVLLWCGGRGRRIGKERGKGREEWDRGRGRGSERERNRKSKIKVNKIKQNIHVSLEWKCVLTWSTFPMNQNSTRTQSTMVLLLLKTKLHTSASQGWICTNIHVYIQTIHTCRVHIQTCTGATSPKGPKIKL